MSQKQLVRCNCGCDTEVPLNRCVHIRRAWKRMSDHVQRPGLVTWIIRKDHEEGFLVELGMITALDTLTRENIGRSWWRRLVIAGQIFDLQFDIRLRTLGEVEAARMAWRTVRLWLCPQWAWLQKRVEFTKISEKNGPV